MICQGSWKRHAWKSGSGENPKCQRCGVERNPRAGGPLHQSELKRPRYKTISAAPGYERRHA